MQIAQNQREFGF